MGRQFVSAGIAALALGISGCNTAVQGGGLGSGGGSSTGAGSGTASSTGDAGTGQSTASGDGGAGQTSSTGDGGYLDTGSSTADTSSSSGDASSTSSTGGAQCDWPPDTTQPFEMPYTAPGMCPSEQGNLIGPFSLAESQQITILREHTLSSYEGQIAGLIEGCEDPGLLGESLLLLSPDRCKAETFTAPPGDYSFVRCWGGNGVIEPISYLVEPVPPAPSNLSCATAVDIGSGPHAEPRVVDPSVRYYRFPVDVPRSIVVGVTYTEKSGNVTGRITRGCDGEVVVDELMFPLCSNSLFLDASLGVFQPGTYVVELTPEAGTRFSVFMSYQ